MLNKISKEYQYLGGVLLFAFILRAYNFFELSFMHDEISALVRTKFDSLSAFFHKGIYVDSHPPLVQVFLFIWTKVFGYGEAIVKFPFLVMSMASLWYLYHVAKNFTQNQWIALGVVLFVSVNQLHIVYSTVARMYITGLFFGLAMVHHWWQWLQLGDKKHFTWMIVFAILSAYNHHLGLLLAILVWVSGWFYLPEGQKNSYFKALFMVLLVYLPCTYITYGQFTNTEGQELVWMESPTYGFTEDFFSYFFHYNYILLLAVLAGLVLGLLRANGIVLLSFGWFVASFVICYAYSALVSPMIQFHLMIFTLPFLILISIYGWVTYLQEEKKIFIAGGIMVTLSLFSLAFGRKHFELFKNQPYKVLAQTIREYKPEKGKILVVTDLDLRYLGYYLVDELKYTDTISEQRLKTKDYSEILDKYSYIITASKNEAAELCFLPEYLAIRNTYQGQSTEIDVLGRRITQEQGKKVIAETDFSNVGTEWFFDRNMLRKRDGKSYFFKTKEELWGPNYEVPFDKKLNGLLCFELSYLGDTSEGLMGLAINFYDANGTEVKSVITDYVMQTRDKGIGTGRAIFDLSNLPSTAVKLKCFHWKKSPTTAEIHQMKVFTMDKPEYVTGRTDSIVTVQNFFEESDSWTKSPVSIQSCEPFGEPFAHLTEQAGWFPSLKLDCTTENVYAFDFEFRAKELSPDTKIILSVKSGEKVVYYSDRSLNTFMKSNGNTWSKAYISAPGGLIEKYKGENLKLEFMCFKAQGQYLDIKNPAVRTFKPNGYLYSLISKID
jgi:hypothetical protein